LQQFEVSLLRPGHPRAEATIQGEDAGNWERKVDIVAIGKYLVGIGLSIFYIVSALTRV